MNTILTTLLCEKCDQTFASIHSNQRNCPTCISHFRHHRNSDHTPISRDLVLSVPVCEIRLDQSLFKLGKQRSRHAAPYLSSVIKGEIASPNDQWIKEWVGRVDVYCNATNLPHVATVRVMAATKASGYVKTHIAIDKIKTSNSPTHALILSSYENPKASWSFKLTAIGKEGSSVSKFLSIISL